MTTKQAEQTSTFTEAQPQVSPPEGEKAAPAEQQGAAQAQKEGAAQAPDLHAEVQRLQAEVQRLEHRARSAEGLNKGVPDRMSSLEGQIRSLTREIRRGEIQRADIDESERNTRLRQLSDEERQEQEAQQFGDHARRLGRRLDTLLSRANISAEHVKVGEALRRWQSARTIDELDDIYDSVEELVYGEVDARHKKAVDDARTEERQARQREAREQEELAVGAGRGSPSRPLTRATAENIDQLYVQYDRQHPGEKNPYEEQYRKFLRTGEI